MNWQRNLWAVSISAFIANISFTMFMPFYPNLLLATGLKDNISLWTGIMVSSSFLAGGLVSPLWGSLADRYGKRLMLARSGYGLVFITILLAYVQNHWQMFFCRIIFGLLGGFIPASIMLIVSNTPQEKMGFALGVLNSFIAIGSIMGPFVGGVLVEYIGVRNNILAAGLILIVATTLSLLGTKEKVHKQEVRTTIRQDMQLVTTNRTLQVFFVSMVVMHFSTFLFTAMLPLRVGELTAVQADLSTGLMFSLTGIALALGSGITGRYDKWNQVHVLLAGLVLSGVLCVLQGITGSLYVLGITRFAFGLSNALVNVAGNVLIARNSQEESRGRVFGILNAFMAIGAVSGPLLGGFFGGVFRYCEFLLCLWAGFFAGSLSHLALYFPYGC